MMNPVHVKILRDGAKLPTYGTAGAAGADLYACKRGLAPANKVGVVDSDYRGEINVVLHNHGSAPQTIENGERVAQLLITPVLQPAYEIAETLTDTARNAGGFGSTGK